MLCVDCKYDNKIVVVFCLMKNSVIFILIFEVLKFICVFMYVNDDFN